jgi:hypothetical protein
MSSFSTITNDSITFYDITRRPPTPADLKSGIYARNKMSGDFVRLPKSTCTWEVSSSKYTCWAYASNFPSFSPYAAKYDDLVAAKDALKNSRYGADHDAIGKAIGLIKRFLETHAK